MLKFKSMKKINYVLVLALFSMLCTTLGVVGCSDDDGDSSYPADLLGTWISESEGEYQSLIASAKGNIYTEKLVIEEDGAMLYDVSYCDDHYSYPMKWYTKGGKFCYEFHNDDKMPEGVNEVMSLDYKLSDNLLEFYYEGELLWSYTRVN